MLTPPTDAASTGIPSNSQLEASKTDKSIVMATNESAPQVAEEHMVSDQAQTIELTNEPLQSETEETSGLSVEPDADAKAKYILEQLKRRQARIENGEGPDDVTTRPPTPEKDFPPDEYFNSVEYADFFSGIRSAALYRAYQIRMRRKEKNSNKSGDLITAMVDYVTKVEDDIARLEKTLDDERLARGMTKDELAKEKGEIYGKSGKDAGHEKSGIKDLAGIAIETRFYHCDGVFGPEGDFARDGNPSTESGHYLSNTDAPHLLRVLYDWKEKNSMNTPPTAPGEPPDHAKIDIIAFMISSMPIADFFEKRLGLSTDATRVVRVGKPFRSIIRNLPQLRGQLSLLESKYGSVPTGADVSGSPQVHAKKPGDEDNARSNPIQLDSKGVKSIHTMEQDIDESKDESSAHISKGKVYGNPESGDEADKTDKVESFESPSALPHFRLLIEFIDHYLGEKTELFERLQVGRGKKVAYEDLWMLFDTGDTIYCPLQEGGVKIFSVSGDDDEFHTTRRRYVPQAYRVVATVGGVPLRETLAPRNPASLNDNISEDALIRLFTNRSSMRAGFEIQPMTLNMPQAQRMKERYTALHVICMYVDFNGFRYGTDTEIFVFKPFDGEMDIKNLAAFPLQYLSTELGKPSSGFNNGQSLDTERAQMKSPDSLLERGRKFIDVTAASQHMSHTGLTVGESKEEVCHGFAKYY